MPETLTYSVGAEPELPEHSGPDGVFGLPAVLGAEQAWFDGMISDRPAPADGTETDADRLHVSAVAEELQSVREDLSALSEEDHDYASAELERSGVPALLWQSYIDYKDKQHSTQALTAWLGDEQGATDAQLLNFLQWHNHNVEQRQDALSPEVWEAIYDAKDDFKAGVQEAVKSGWLHPDALALSSQIDDVPIYIGDIFDQVLYEDSAHYLPESDAVVMTGYGDDYRLIKTIRFSTKHEFSHAVFAKDIQDEWLDEALPEHIAQAMDYGEPGIVDPSQRAHADSTYYEERALLHTLLSYGATVVAPEVATRMYSGDEVALKEFNRELDAAWLNDSSHQDVLGYVRTYLEAKTEQLMQASRYSDQVLDTDTANKQALTEIKYDLQMKPWVVFGKDCLMQRSQAA